MVIYRIGTNLVDNHFRTFHNPPQLDPSLTLPKGEGQTPLLWRGWGRSSINKLIK